MATNYLGPEAPSPFSVISENDSNFYSLPEVPEYERFSFGEPYEKKMVSLIHQYLELGTDDAVCYVGHHKGSLAGLIQQRFCLLKPLTTVAPGFIHYEKTPANKMVPVRIQHVGADQFFRDEAKKPAQFDRVLLKDAIDYLTEPKETFRNIMDTVRPGGKMLIIHRPAAMNTLPLFADARGHMTAMDQSYMGIIERLQDLKMDVQWEVECLPIVMPKFKWMSMLRDQFPTHMDGLSSLDIRLGIRELSEGVLKYEGEVVQFSDRLLFVSASRGGGATYPSIQRFGASPLHPFPCVNKLQFRMEVTPDVEKLVAGKLAQQRLDRK